MTTTRPRSATNSGNSHNLALWAGVTALCTNLAALNILALLGDTDELWAETAAALITAIASAGAVYARQRMADEKARRGKEK